MTEHKLVMLAERDIVVIESTLRHTQDKRQAHTYPQRKYIKLALDLRFSP